MQSYSISLTPDNSARSFNVSARRFVYESGATAPDGGDTRIVVKPDNGSEIVLRPGQTFALAPSELASTWHVRAYDTAVSLQGTIIIGSGEFFDANTQNTFKFDASGGSVPVTVSNTEAARVPVSFDPEQSIFSAAPTMSFNDSFFRTAGMYMPGAYKLIDPAKNVRGIVLFRTQLLGLKGINSVSPNDFSLLVKATAPVSQYDGVVLDAFSTGKDGDAKINYYGKEGQNNANAPFWRLPPGMGLWVYNKFGSNFDQENFIFQVL